MATKHSGNEPVDEDVEQRHRIGKPSLDMVLSANSSTDTLDKLLKDEEQQNTKGNQRGRIHDSHILG